MNRSPEFIILFKNPAMNDDVKYARFAGTTDVLCLIGIAETAHIFDQHHVASMALKALQQKHSNNKWIQIWIERIDLCDSILEDIDNMSEL